MAQNNSCTCLDVLSIDLTSCIRTGFIYLHHAYVPRRLYAWRSLDVCHAYLDLSQPEQAINVYVRWIVLFDRAARIHA